MKTILKAEEQTLERLPFRRQKFTWQLSCRLWGVSFDLLCNHQDPSRTWNPQAWKDERKHCPKHRLRKKLPYIHCISAMVWNIQLAWFPSRKERVWPRKWKAVAEVEQLKQRERDFLPRKLYLLWIYKLSPYLWPATTAAFVSSSTKEKDNFKVCCRSKYIPADKAWLAHIFLSHIRSQGQASLKAKQAKIPNTTLAKCLVWLQLSGHCSQLRQGTIKALQKKTVEKLPDKGYTLLAL